MKHRITQHYSEHTVQVVIGQFYHWLDSYRFAGCQDKKPVIDQKIDDLLRTCDQEVANAVIDELESHGF